MTIKAEEALEAADRMERVLASTRDGAFSDIRTLIAFTRGGGRPLEVYETAEELAVEVSRLRALISDPTDEQLDRAVDAFYEVDLRPGRSREAMRAAFATLSAAREIPEEPPVVPDDSEFDEAFADAEDFSEAIGAIIAKYYVPVTANEPRWQNGQYLRHAGDFLGDVRAAIQRFPEYPEVPTAAAGAAPARPTTQGGVWGSYVPYLKELEAVVAGPPPEDRAVTVRENPKMPPDDVLREIARHTGVGYYSGSAVKALRAVWRHGCDAGMVAP